ncbi:MAG: ATP-binding cassette domain-containing protein [Flavobacteriales bacterium]|nr:ATP-binding cassette domain-containing protein [Flavobacteriales bacterium]MCX7650057.1 ATP-binding cassette domain-containing protein [Flavobacteriales bacterium]MDW8431184.1 ATP-binding cassette domain-containing protein [Flavobacteriales bacterium]
MAEPLIRLKDVTLFRDHHLVLENVSFEVQPGEFVYLIGKTGSGKSSLLKLLYGEVKPASGEAIICHTDLLSLRRSQVHLLRRRLGMVFQDFQLLFDRSVGKNFEFVMRAVGVTQKSHIQTRSQEVLALVGLDHILEKMPHELSGGEQQRVVIARALLNGPEVILADEPTGNLDPETSYDIIRLLRNLSMTGVTVLVATHDMNVVERFPSRMFIFENKMLKEFIPPKRG